MFNRFVVSLFILFFICFNVSAMNVNNPFAKNESLNIGKDIAWNIDKQMVLATKSSSDDKGNYYHLQFDNKQLKLSISTDADGSEPKQFSQLEIKDVEIDGKQSPLFKWCLTNQERHSRFLQQGLSVKKDICVIDGDAGTFIMMLNKDTLMSLQQGSRLLIMLKPFRTPLELNYDISDFRDMYLVLNAKPEPKSKTIPVVAVVAQPNKKCWAGPPAEYTHIKAVEYACNDTVAKIDAETWVTRLVSLEKAKEQKLAAEKEKQLKLAEEKRKKELAEKLKQEEKLKAEAAAIAASEAKQAQISGEITRKMISVCDKFWSKGEHRCYCQKYIEHAPASIQASSTCD